MYFQNTNPFRLDELIPPVKRTVFFSHYKGDHDEVEDFIRDFKGVFIPKVLGANDNYDYIDSTNTDYVMNQIRTKYLQDSTVTIVLIGKCTHSRRYVDWEIKSSLRQGSYIPNGLIGILLPSVGDKIYLPQRLFDNCKSGYAKCYYFPKTKEILHEWIEDAYEARTERANLIVNPQEMMKNNTCCMVCGFKH